MPRRAAVSSTRPSTSPAGTRAMVSGRATFSRAVRVSSRLEFWKMKPSFSRRNFVSERPRSPVTSRPPTSTWPLVGVSMVEMQLSSVDLPEPEAPMIETSSPAQTSNETSASARVVAPRPP